MTNPLNLLNVALIAVLLAAFAAVQSGAHDQRAGTTSPGFESGDL